MDNNTCTCGRSWTHCPVCGSRNLYYIKNRTRWTGLSWYACKGSACRQEFNLENFECKAPPLIQNTNFVPYTKDRPQDRLSVDDPEYGFKLKQRFDELMSKKGMTIDKAIISMKLDGWNIDLSKKEEPKPLVTEPEPEQPTMSIEDIIKAMTEGKK